jgi:hypothetical protein
MSRLLDLFPRPAPYAHHATRPPAPRFCFAGYALLFEGTSTSKFIRKSVVLDVAVSEFAWQGTLSGRPVVWSEEVHRHDVVRRQRRAELFSAPMRVPLEYLRAVSIG